MSSAKHLQSVKPLLESLTIFQPEWKIVTWMTDMFSRAEFGLDTNIPKNALNIYPEILSFFPKDPSKNL